MFELSQLFSNATLHALILPFSFDFMLQAFIVVLVISLPMAVLSCYIVLKGWSLMGDAIAHAVLPGIVLAYLLAIPLSIGAFAVRLQLDLLRKTVDYVKILSWELSFLACLQSVLFYFIKPIPNCI